ncbi:MAG: Nif3-like dinuclear metal center hexameric protein [Deltaproteobacteria bacterium]|nr:Nif3-like dinuclear metal center hexameric protein [Deltaproteobacteria bacterium]
MAHLNEITDWLTSELRLSDFQDSSLNGLQIEGKAKVKRIAFAVDAALKTAELAREAGADFLLVHHGVFWEKPLAVRGPHKQLVKTLLDAEISLYAAHLPLDAHAQYGNNFSLARHLGLEDLEPCISYCGNNIGCRGSNPLRLSLDDIRKRLCLLPGANPNMLLFDFGPNPPEEICIVSGSGADALCQFQSVGFDTLITGEARQFAYHYALENKLNAFFAGHYATEVIGVKQLTEALAQKFLIECIFVDCPTGV